MIRHARRVAVRRGLARPAGPGRPHHHPDRRRRRTCGRAAARCGPTPRRSTRASRGGSGSPTTQLAEVYPWEDWILARSLVGTPAEGTLEDDLFAGCPHRGVRRPQHGARRDERAVPGGVRQEGRSGRRPRRRRRRGHRRRGRRRGSSPTVAFMRGKLKSTGPTGPLLAAFADGVGGCGASAGSHRVPERAIADRRRAGLGEQRAQRGVGGDQLVVVDPRSRRGGDGPHLGRVDRPAARGSR